MINKQLEEKLIDMRAPNSGRKASMTTSNLHIDTEDIFEDTV